MEDDERLRFIKKAVNEFKRTGSLEDLEGIIRDKVHNLVINPSMTSDNKPRIPNPSKVNIDVAELNTVNSNVEVTATQTGNSQDLGPGVYQYTVTGTTGRFASAGPVGGEEQQGYVIASAPGVEINTGPSIELAEPKNPVKMLENIVEELAGDEYDK